MDRRVLIVDDSAVMRQMLGSTLRTAGYEVSESATGEEALAEVASADADKQTFSLVITDFNMPEMNGADLTRKLRAIPAYRSAPILVLTTESAETTKQMAKAAGATGWMAKPFDPPALVNVVERVLG